MDPLVELCLPFPLEQRRESRDLLVLVRDVDERRFPVTVRGTIQAVHGAMPEQGLLHERGHRAVTCDAVLVVEQFDSLCASNQECVAAEEAKGDGACAGSGTVPEVRPEAVPAEEGWGVFTKSAGH